MTSRRKFLLNGGLATTAFLATSPLKAISKWAAPFSGNSSLALMFTHNIQQRLNANPLSFQKTHETINALRLPNAILLETGKKKNIPLLLNDAAFSNLHYDNELAPNGACQLLRKGHYKIGVIHVDKINSDILNNTSNEILQLSADLKKIKRCDFVICMDDHGILKQGEEKKIALNSEYIDLMVCRQSLKEKHQKPLAALNKARREVYINYTGFNDLLVGTVELKFNAQGERNGIMFNNVLAKSPDPLVRKYRP